MIPVEMLKKDLQEQIDLSNRLETMLCKGSNDFTRKELYHLIAGMKYMIHETINAIRFAENPFGNNNQ